MKGSLIVVGFFILASWQVAWTRCPHGWQKAD